MTKLLKDEHNGSQNQDEMRDSEWKSLGRWGSEQVNEQNGDYANSGWRRKRRRRPRQCDGSVNVFAYVVKMVLRCWQNNATSSLSSCHRTWMLNNIKLPKLLHIPRHHNIDDNNFANAFIYFARDFSCFRVLQNDSSMSNMHYFCTFQFP